MTDEKKDEVVAAIGKVIAEDGRFRLATDEEVGALLEEGKEERERQHAEMEKPDYGDKLKARKDEWYCRANDRSMTLRSLPGFLAELAESEHDYNSIVYAVAAAAIAAARALDRSPNGGITGFQAGDVFWEFFGEWMHKRGKPARLVSYENMLFPQYEDNFAKTITPDTWKWLQEEARKNLAEAPSAHGDVADHWRAIVSGAVPFGYVVSSDM